MNTAAKHTLGVAFAFFLFLGFNAINEHTRIFPDYQTQVTPADNRPVATLRDFNDAIVDIAEATNPSVVTITTEQTRQVRVIDPFSFFRNPYNQRGNEPQTREQIRKGLGSGVIVSNDGYIITNNHVIDGADEGGITVEFINGEQMEAELIGADPSTDLAVIKVEAKNLPSISIGNSDDLKVGSFVLAIGSPLSENLNHTVSFGIVSAKNRNISLIEGGAGYEEFIQTDAAINPGNSGGALVNLDGELVGINSAIASRSGGNDGIGFSIPSNLAKRIMEDLLDDGIVSRGFLGINYGGDVDQVMAEAMGLDNVRGFIIGEVTEKGPSDKAGLKEQDIIVELNGKPVGDWALFRSKIAGFRPGETIELGIVRDGKERAITVKLGTRPGEEELAETPSAESEDMDEMLGFEVTTLNDSYRQQLQIEDKVEGALIREITQSSAAYKRGLREGDVILSVNNNDVASSGDFYSEMDRVVESGKTSVFMKINRSGSEQFFSFRLQ
ncbi:MAG: Do family serine endopeptidase [Bacteroidota bacterium]